MPPWLPSVPRRTPWHPYNKTVRTRLRIFRTVCNCTYIHCHSGQKKAATRATLKRNSQFLHHIDMLLVLFLLRSRLIRRAQQPSLKNRNLNGCKTDPLLAHPLYRRVRRAEASATAIPHHSPVVNATSPPGRVDMHSVPSPPPRSSPSPSPAERDRAPRETSHCAAWASQHLRHPTHTHPPLAVAAARPQERLLRCIALCRRPASRDGVKDDAAVVHPSDAPCPAAADAQEKVLARQLATSSLVAGGRSHFLVLPFFFVTPSPPFPAVLPCRATTMMRRHPNRRSCPHFRHHCGRRPRRRPSTAPCPCRRRPRQLGHVYAATRERRRRER